MVSEDFYAIRHLLENQLNTYNQIVLGFHDSLALVNRLYALEEQIIALENSVVPQRERLIESDHSNVVRLDHWKAKKGA